MAKDPAFLFYPNDYIGGTMGMTFEEKGAYIELLMLQFNRGHMTKHMIGQTVGQIWDNLQDKFKVDEKGLYYNARLEEEQTKRKNYSSSRRNNKSGNNQYSNKDKKEAHTQGHMTVHMEDVNEDVNENNNKGADSENFVIPSLEDIILYGKSSDISKEICEAYYNSRMATNWKRNNQAVENWQYDLRGFVDVWNTNHGISKDGNEINVMPNYYSQKFEKTLQGSEIIAYHKHLKSLGWESHYSGTAGTTWNKTPKTASAEA